MSHTASMPTPTRTTRDFFDQEYWVVIKYFISSILPRWLLMRLAKVLLPKTSSLALRFVIVLIALVVAAFGVGNIVVPLVKYRAYAYYYAKVNFPEFIFPLLCIWFSVSVWRLRRWARTVLQCACWFLAILNPPFSLIDYDADRAELWSQSASLLENISTSPAVHLYALAAVALLIIHLLQVHKGDFQSGF